MTKPISLPVLLFASAAWLAVAAPQAHAGEAVPASAAADASFNDWLAAFRAQAEAAGISRATLDATLTGLVPNAQVLANDQRQPEFVQTFWNYLDARLTDKRIAAGKALLAGNAALFAAAEQRYGVPARYLAAFWGQETGYGTHMGDIDIVQALATLAYDNRRAGFFRAQLLDALRIVDSGNMPAGDLRGSWAGAFGHMQFMPSTFLRYGVDGDGDGKINLRASLPDAIDSAANYLSRAGWLSGQDWGQEVLLPPGFDWGQARLGRWKTVHAWSALGVLQADGRPLSRSSQTAAILLPQGRDGPAVMVTENFNVILRWNRSVNYALAVGLLADRLDDRPGLIHGRGADNRPLTHEQAIDLQNCLTALGFDPGPPDGMLGSRTLDAIRAYQASAGLPADGYASATLMEQLRASLQAKGIRMPAAMACSPSHPEDAL